MPTFQVQSIHVAPQFIEKMPELKVRYWSEIIIRMQANLAVWFFIWAVLLVIFIISNIFSLKDNPFVERILRVFSGDGTGFMNFENFLDMFNVLSEQASVELKTYYAFKIYGWELLFFIYFKISATSILHLYRSRPRRLFKQRWHQANDKQPHQRCAIRGRNFSCGG